MLVKSLEKYAEHTVSSWQTHNCFHSLLFPHKMFGYFNKKDVVYMYFSSGWPSNVGKYLHFYYPETNKKTPCNTYLQVPSEIKPLFHKCWLVNGQFQNWVWFAKVTTEVISLRGQSPGMEILTQLPLSQEHVKAASYPGRKGILPSWSKKGDSKSPWQVDTG